MVRINGNKLYTNWDEVPMVMTIADASMVIQTNPEWIRKGLVKGIIPGFKLGNEWRIYRDEFMRYVEGLQNGT